MYCRIDYVLLVSIYYYLDWGGAIMKCISYKNLFGSNGFYNKRLEKNTIYVGKVRYLPLSIVKNFKLQYLHDNVREVKINDKETTDYQ